MESIVINPSNKKELELIKSMLKKMSIDMKVLKEEDKEDFGLLKAMLDTNADKEVDKDTIIKALKD